jgi:hypothetical protein
VKSSLGTGRVDERVSAENAMPRKLYGHVNVSDVDIGILCDGDSLLDGGIELVRCCVFRLGLADPVGRGAGLAADRGRGPDQTQKKFWCEVNSGRKSKTTV